MNAFWVCLCLSAYGRPFGACCPWQHTRLTAPLFHTRRSRRLPKRAFSDTLPYHYITPLPHTKFAHSTHRVPPHTKFAHSTHHAHTYTLRTFHSPRPTYTLREFHTPHTTHTSRVPHTYTLRVFHSPSSLTHHARPRATSNHPTLCYILHLTVTK